jgi:cytoskeletal protein CcmA (bactofilin family)
MGDFYNRGGGGVNATEVTATSVTSDDLEIDSGTLSIDATNNRVGLGTTAPGTQLQVESNTPYVTLKNDTAENTAGGCESKVIFEDHGNNALGQIEVSHVGSSDDEKGQLIISTNNDSGLQAAITINEAQKVTAAGDVQVTGDIILDDGGSLKEAGGTAAITFDGSGNVTKIGVDSASSGQFLKWNGSKWIAATVSGTVAGSVAADDISAGDAAINLTTTTGNITIDAQGNDTDIIFKGTDNNSDTTFLTLDGSEAGAATFNDKIIATELDISGNVDIDGTCEADAYTVDGVALATFVRDTVGTNMVSSNTETGITVTYDTSNDNLDFAVDAAQTGITSVLNTSLVIGRDADNQIKFGTDNEIIFEVSGGDGVTFKASGEIEATSLDISGDVDVDGTLEADAITLGGVALASSATTDTTNASNIGSGTVNAARMAAAQTAITSVLNTSLVAGRDADNQIKFSTDNEIIFRVSGGDGVTMKASGEIEATSLDISGDADIDGTLEADAITVDGTALAEYISDTVGAMVGSNTETGITVTYQDADNTIDFVLDAVGTNAISDNAVTLDKLAGIARGKIIYGDASGDPAVLAPGSNNQVLTSDGTDISWQNASGGGTAVDDLNLILHTQVFS